MADEGAGVRRNEPDPPLYSAFISYNHHDRAIATRLQRRIETYRLPHRLQRKGAPARLKPVFRDRDEMTAAPDLDEAVQAALRQSEHLIVVCTPAAAASEWVGREIAYYREVHGSDGILTALFDGEPDAAFHRALLKRTDTAEAHPLAADFRAAGDGRRLALLKLIAPLAHVRLDELVQRDAQRHVRQIAIIAFAAVVGVIIAATLVFLALQARADAERERTRSVDAMHFQLTEVRRRLGAAGRLDLLAAVNEGVERNYKGRDPRSLTVPELLQSAELLQAEAKDDEQRADYTAARKQVIEAWRLTAPLVTAFPDDPKIIFAHAQSEYFMGFVDWRLGDAAHAKLRFENYAALADRLVAKDPKNPTWRREKAYAANQLGMLALRQGTDTAQARSFFTAAQDEFLAIAKENPDDPEIRSEIADGEAWLADVDRAAGDLPAARSHREAQHRIVAEQVRRAPHNAHLRENFVRSKLGLARVIAAQGQFAQAIAQFEAAHQIAEELAATDEDNKAIARHKRAIEVFEAQTWLSMPRRERPALAQVAAKLGDCTTDWAKPRNDELAALCELGLIRLADARGNTEQARAILKSASEKRIFKSAYLSERYHVDMNARLRELALENHL